MEIGGIQLDIDWYYGLMKFVLAPAATICAWFVFDRILLYMHRKKITKLHFAGHIDEAKQNAMLQRVKTFRGLFIQFMRIFSAVIFLGILLHQFNIDLKPLLAGVGVVGLGASFAAQNILRDFLNGFFIVVEDQYNVGDWDDIGAFSGTVTNFTLRTTRLRTTEGRLIIIPNSTVSQVVNHTKEWAVATVDIGVGYDTDIPTAIAVLEKCCAELREQYHPVILEKSQILAIVDFRPNDMLIRVLTKTVAGEQWVVGRYLRRLIKVHFNEAGIDIPLPQVVVRQADSDIIKNLSDTPDNPFKI